MTTIDKQNKELEDKTCMCSTMGKFYEFKKDFTNAFNHYNQAFTIYSKENHNPCNCSVGYLAHCYYKGIGVKQDISKAQELIKNGITKMGKNSSNSVIYLYAHFSLMGYDGFELLTAKELLLWLTSAESSKVITDATGMIPARKVTVRDTTGAGDIFHGAFTYGIANGYSLENSVKLGNIAGALSTTKMGSRNSVPTLKQVMEFYEK